MYIKFWNYDDNNGIIFFFFKKWIIYKLCDMYCNKIIYIFFNEGFVENKLNEFFVCFVVWLI